MVREDEEVDTGSPSSRAKDGDPLRVSTKVADILVEPAKSLDLVQEAIVPLGGLITGTEETWKWRVYLEFSINTQICYLVLVNVPEK